MISDRNRLWRVLILGLIAILALSVLVLVFRAVPRRPLSEFELNWPRLEHFIRHVDQRLVAFLFTAFTALVWLAIIRSYHMYSHRSGSVARLLLGFVLGALFAYPAALAQQSLAGIFPTPIPDRLPKNLASTFIVIASVEEMFKLFAGYLAFLGLRKAERLPEGAILFGAAALGFATFENQLYFSFHGPQLLPDRFLVSVLTHIGCSGIAGHFIARAKLTPGTVKLAHVKAVLLPILLHGVYNTLIFEGGRVAPLSLLVAGVILYSFHRHFISDVMDAMTRAGVPPARGERSFAWIIFVCGGGLSIALGVGYNFIKTGAWPDASYLFALLGIFFYLFHFYLRDPDEFAVGRAENLIFDGRLEEAKLELARILDTQLGEESPTHAAFLHGLIDLTEGSPWRALERIKMVEDDDTPELRILQARCLACLGRHQELRELLRSVERGTRERFLIALNLALAYLLVERPREALKIILHLPTKRRSWWLLDLFRNINRFRTFKSVGQGLFGHRENMKLLRIVKRSLLKQLTEERSGLSAVIRLIWNELHRPAVRKIKLPTLRFPSQGEPQKSGGGLD